MSQGLLPDRGRGDDFADIAGKSLVETGSLDGEIGRTSTGMFLRRLHGGRRGKGMRLRGVFENRSSGNDRTGFGRRRNG